ncbi:GNAT family N-acetyltransferase [Marinitoga lauensis]|uniref:GNAT family N-acetyltransferase n=1 Tax=Marinitoga lauensis TaxID=2201189 RepID=UPI00140440A3|nr:GNAT family N-acetyltransferase [Marinitoga lauensis]
MIIRKAEKKDKKDLVEVSKYAWEDDYIPIVFDEWVNDKNSNFYVIEENGKVIGCGRMKELKKGVFWLEGLRVHGNYRNKGYGKKLSEFFLQLAKEKGYKKIMFSTYYQNIESRHIMENYGFRVYKEFKWIYYNNKNNKIETKNFERFEIAKNFEEVKSYILNSREYRYSKILSFDWIFIELDEALLKKLFDREEIYILKKERNIESLIILSSYMKKYNTLSISFISRNYEKALNFSIDLFSKTDKIYMTYMIPKGQIDKRIALNKGFIEEDKEENNVFLYVLEKQ